MDVEGAREAWLRLLGDRGMATSRDRFGFGTGTQPREVVAVLIPESVEATAEIVRIAMRTGVPLYPISTGHNWGYGDADPVREGCAIVELSRMNRIASFDEDLGLVTVEPGVTQGILAAFLAQRNLPFMVPTTGAGPAGSLIGNALERGFGIAPICDHFEAVTALEAILPDGSRYRSVFTEMGATLADRAHKWGVGPYLDGLFTQSNLGIVTEMTIALFRRPESMLPLFFTFNRDQDLPVALGAVRSAQREVGSLLGGLKLLNAAQIGAYAGSMPSAGFLSSIRWLGSGCLYGPRDVVAGARAVLKRTLGPSVGMLQFADPWKMRLVSRTASILTPLKRAALSRLDGNIRLMAGFPDDTGLALAYRDGNPTGDPAKDGKGLLWYTPIVPFVPATIARCVRLVEEVCAEFASQPLIAITTLSARAVCLAIPLVFDRRDSGAAERATACYQALFDRGRAEGWLPYRMGIEAMARLVDPALPFWSLVRKLKLAVDPGGIMAPGRYNLD